MYKIKTLLVCCILLMCGTSIAQLQKQTPNKQSAETKVQTAEVGTRQSEAKKTVIHVDSNSASQKQNVSFEDAVKTYSLEKVNFLLNAYQTKYDNVKSQESETSKDEMIKLESWYDEMEAKISILKNRHNELKK